MKLAGWKQTGSSLICPESKGPVKPIQVLRNHDGERIVGHGVATVAAGKLSLEGVVSSSSADANEVVTLAANGFPWQASIGAEPIKVEFPTEQPRGPAQVKRPNGHWAHWR